MIEKLDYHDFWDIFMQEYLPAKITDDWLLTNEAFIEELINSNYRTYELGYISDKIVMRQLAEILLLCFVYFREYNII